MSTDDSFNRVRHDFEDLEIEQQAQFLIEASASTLARGIEQLGQTLAEGLGDTMRNSCGGAASSDEGPGPAEPETAQRQADMGEANESDIGSSGT